MTIIYNNSAETMIGFLALFNTYTLGLGWVLTVFIIGFIIFVTLKVNDINDSLMLSSFVMTFLSFLLNFIGLINVYFLGIFFGIFLLSLIFKVVFK